MTNKTRQMPPRETAVAEDMRKTPEFLTIYAACLQGLCCRLDLDWHHEHLAERAMLLAETAYKRMKEN